MLDEPEIPGMVLLEIASQAMAKSVAAHDLFAVVGLGRKVATESLESKVDLPDMEGAIASQGFGMEMLPLSKGHTLVNLRNMAVTKMTDEVEAVFLAAKGNMPGDQTRSDLMTQFRQLGAPPDLSTMASMVKETMEKNGDAGQGGERIAVFGMNREKDGIVTVLTEGSCKSRAIEERDWDLPVFRAIRYVLNHA